MYIIYASEIIIFDYQKAINISMIYVYAFRIHMIKYFQNPYYFIKI